jgi:ABC-type amino acid transport substrate-binding protein
MVRNRRSGMSRRRFLGAVGAGAAGMAGLGMMGSGVAYAASPPMDPPYYVNAGPTVADIRTRKLKALYPAGDEPPFHLDAPKKHNGYDCDFVRALAAAIFNSKNPDRFIQWILMPQYYAYYIDNPERDEHGDPCDPAAGDPDCVQVIEGRWNSRFSLLIKGETDDFGNYADTIDVSAVVNTHKYHRDTYIPSDEPLQAQWGPTYYHDNAGVAYNTGGPYDLSSLNNIPYTSDVPAGTPLIRLTCRDGTSNSQLVDQLIDNGRHVIKVPNPDSTDMVRQVALGNVDGAVDDFSGLEPIIPDINAQYGVNIVLGAVLSINPIGWCIAEGDPKFLDILNWVTWGLFAATEYGIGHGPTESMDFDDPRLPTPMKYLFGIEPLPGLDGQYLWEARGCDRHCFQKVIQAVGNWGNMWDRSVGKPRTGANSTAGRMFYPVIG